ncbi:MAG: hydrolase or [Rhodospirillaceae bacterium]|nr:MAG: hydrolase or [Rhodospirillaceae bacterium]TNC93932.1 MAG: hydrolase or acyltransferase [Stygiobacter sp.]
MLRVLILLSALLAGGPAWAQKLLPPSAIVTENLQFDARDDDLRLHLRNKHPDDYYSPKPETTVLFLHGATFPGIATFDHAIDGQSWLDYLARRGYDVYALDIRGYGASTKPAEMSQPPEGKAPLVDSVAALRDVSKTVEYILSRRNLDKLTIVGWSWGATLAGSYAANASNKIHKLVLYSPPWISDEPAGADAVKELGAWRGVPLFLVSERWGHNLPDKERKELITPEAKRGWMNALAETAGGEQLLKVPNGAVADALKTWGANTPAWHPERISAPTMVVQGEWDADTPPAMGLSVFAHLTGTSSRRYVLIGEGTHLLLLEKNRRQLFQTVHGFLEEQR